MIANDLNCCHVPRTFEPRTLKSFPRLTGACTQGMALFLIGRLPRLVGSENRTGACPVGSANRTGVENQWNFSPLDL